MINSCDFHLQFAESVMQKNSEMDCEKTDESNVVLSESLKISVHLNDKIMVEKGKQTFCSVFSSWTCLLCSL